jgi:hypothetical protein
MDRLFWASLSRLNGCGLASHGLSLVWTWKVRRGQPGRPAIARETRDLIRRIHGELLKLGIDIGESSVTKYMVRCRKRPSQTWCTVLDNHVSQLVSTCQRQVNPGGWPRHARRHCAFPTAHLGISSVSSTTGAGVTNFPITSLSEHVSQVRLVTNLCIIGAFTEAQDHGKGT